MLTGTPFPGAGRHSVGAKSPLTGPSASPRQAASGAPSCATPAGTRSSSTDVPRARSTCGSRTIRSRSATPAHLWGKETGEVEDTIRVEHGDRLVRVAQTGIAGEHGVRYALVVNDLNEVAGRGGLGAVMASKNLKAIAVRGTQQSPGGRQQAAPADRASGSSIRWKTIHYNFHHFGTGAAIIGKHLEGHMIVRNFQDGQWTRSRSRRIDAKTFAESPYRQQDGWLLRLLGALQEARKDEAMGVVPGTAGPSTRHGRDGHQPARSTICRCLLRINQRLNQVGIDTRVVRGDGRLGDGVLRARPADRCGHWRYRAALGRRCDRAEADRPRRATRRTAG